MKSITSGERLTESATSQCIITTTDSIMTSLPANQKLVTTQEYLEKMLVEDKKKESGLLYFKENHTDDTVAWTIDATKKNRTVQTEFNWKVQADFIFYIVRYESL
jgi:hypothetical protein